MEIMVVAMDELHGQGMEDEVALIYLMELMDM